MNMRSRHKEQGAYLIPASGINGQDFSVYGDQVNFNLKL